MCHFLLLVANIVPPAYTLECLCIFFRFVFMFWVKLLFFHFLFVFAQILLACKRSLGNCNYVLGSNDSSAGGWRVGSVAKSTGCSCGEPRFDSEHPLGGPQPSLTSVPGYPMPSSDL